MGDLLQPWHLMVLSIVLLFFILPLWQIFKKAGYPPVLSLLVFIPYLGLIAVLWFAYSDWPVLKELRQRRGERPREA